MNWTLRLPWSDGSQLLPELRKRAYSFEYPQGQETTMLQRLLQLLRVKRWARKR